MKQQIILGIGAVIAGTIMWLGGCGNDDAGANPDTGSGGDTDSDGDSDSDAGTDTDSDGDSACDENTGADIAFETELNVGPGQEFEEPGDVPWESLAQGTLVRIHHRNAPYSAKWVINTVATADQPLVVRGIVEQGGERPVITGRDAVTRTELSYWNENRSVIKIGGANLPSDDLTPAHIHLENLEIRSARPPLQFTNDDGDNESYAENAASVHIERGDFVTIRNCVIHDSGNGVFAGHGSSNILITGNHIYDNGIENSILQHNSYTESFQITFQYNHYGPLRSNCLGNNLKDRSAGTVIRYNWIESGNRQLDLVESDYKDFVTDPSYKETFVYGNVLNEPDGAGNSQIVHYGGDGRNEAMYRTGTLYFYHNTVVSTRLGNTTLFRLSTGDVDADVRNNVIYGTAGGSRMAICSGTGNPTLSDNWLPTGFRDTHESSMTDGVVTDNGNIEGKDPGFSDMGSHEFAPAAGSPLANQAGPVAKGVPKVACEYVPHLTSRTRRDDGNPDIGAFESE